MRTPLLVEWIRIPWPVQGTQVWSLVWEDSMCCGTSKPSCHNYWACVLQWLKPGGLESVLQTREATAIRSPLTTTKNSPCSLQLEKAHIKQQRASAAKNKYIKTVIPVKSLSHVWLFRDHMDCSLSDCSVHRIFPARILEWVAISFSRGSSWPREPMSPALQANSLPMSYQGSPE